MAIDPSASQRGSSVKWASRTPPRAKKSPISAPMSSSSTTGSSGSFAVRIHVHHETPGRPAMAWPRGTPCAARCYSRTMANTRIPIATQRFSTSCGWRSLEMPS